MTADAKLLADEIELDGIERVVYGEGIAVRRSTSTQK